MQSGSIPFSEIDGGLDLRATLESGLSFLWRRTDGATYEGAELGDGDWYYAVVRGDTDDTDTAADGDPDVVFARQRSDRLEWRTTADAADPAGCLRRRLRLDDDLDAIFAGFPADEPLERARRAYPGLRVVRDPFFPCLVSFICSARTAVGRIHALQTELAEAFGDAVAVDGTTYHAYPRPEQLAAASEERLRDLGLGFRAPYVERTAEMVATGELGPADLRGEPYEDARERLQSFPGVGPKVADCVALFALGHLQAVPVDRWTRRIVERYYPDLARESYDATADAFRDRFDDCTGYAQTYLYHCERSREE